MDDYAQKGEVKIDENNRKDSKNNRSNSNYSKSRTKIERSIPDLKNNNKSKKETNIMSNDIFKSVDLFKDSQKNSKNSVDFGEKNDLNSFERIEEIFGKRTSLIQDRCDTKTDL